MFELLLPGPLHLFVVLVLLCVAAFRRRETRLGRARWLLAAAAVATYLSSTTVIANAIVRRLERAHPAVAVVGKAAAGGEGDPLVVVLSSGTSLKRGDGWEVRLDAAGWERLHAGLTLWREVGGRILFAGGPTPDGKSSEAAVMAQVAAASGVPASAITVEGQSRNTYENLAFSRELLARQRGRVFLVTSAQHMTRALAVANRLELRVEEHPCDHRAIELRHWYAWLPDNGGASLFGDVLHELAGLVWYRAKGWAR